MSEPRIGQINVPTGLEQVRDVPERARPYKWKPGQSGNPTGRGRLYQECRRLAAEASPNAMRKLIKLMDAEDERVAYMATVAVLDRAGVKPIDFDPNEAANALNGMSIAERKARLAELITRAQALISAPAATQQEASAAPSDEPERP
jgi:hypothetical protein